MARKSHSKRLPVIDLFAGPGGLGEGFESLRPSARRFGFRLALSIEADAWAHQTLELRTFYRQFDKREVPQLYYRYLRGEIPREQLFSAFPEQAARSSRIARKATLGEEPPKNVDRWIHDALGEARLNNKWVLVGGPPCQAYSLVGRARRTREARKQFESDQRHYLYREYLRILKRHRPGAFVMENVKGILSASLGGERIFGKICHDLADAGYELFCLTKEPSRDLALSWHPPSFVVKAERYGVPQSRHRVFVVGLLKGTNAKIEALRESDVTPAVADAIGDLPPLRSLLSARNNGKGDWETAREIGLRMARSHLHKGECVPLHGARFLKTSGRPLFRPAWFHDPRLGGIINHEARSHMAEDISRYAFVAAYARLHGRSPTLPDFPRKLLPKHHNVVNCSGLTPFEDRFRVQIEGKPSSTITSHISKDGHYYIHPDPRQARSLTVREAARLQTFPDNYLFEGPRTEQYRQVGNAVPPLLAVQIAAAIAACFR